MIRLNTESGKKTAHSYSIGTKIDGKIDSIEVWANNRDQAARIAKKAGYEVRDVNMIG